MWALIIIMVVVMVLSVIITKQTIEKFSPNVHFITSITDFEHIISASPFFARMSPIDLYARGSKSPTEYKKTYIAAFLDFTPEEKKRLHKLASRIHYAPNIPWKFAKVSTNIENGFPHTLEDIIVLSNKSLSYDDRSLTETLVHEKVHILQRKKPAYVAALIKRWGFIKVDAHITHPLKRNNPDLPDENYALSPNTVIMQLYNSDRPSNIADSQPFVISIDTKDIIPFHNPGNFPSYVHQLEHPYEIMATVVAREYMNLSFQNPQRL